MEKEVLLAYRNATEWMYTAETSEIGAQNFHQSRFSDILNKIDKVLEAMDEMVCILKWKEKKVKSTFPLISL